MPRARFPKRKPAAGRRAEARRNLLARIRVRRPRAPGSRLRALTAGAAERGRLLSAGIASVLKDRRLSVGAALGPRWAALGLLVRRGWQGCGGARAAVAALCVGMIAIALACGDDNDDPASGGTSGSSSAAGNIISDDEVRTSPAGSPERALLRFFQAVQFQDFEAAAHSVTAAELRSLGRPTLRAAVAAVGPNFGKPQVQGVRREGRRAAVRALVLGFVSGKDEPTSTSPATFVLRRERGEWRLADLSYLMTTANAISEAERKRREGR